mmetsp:Transcript_80119/g.225141  ORF Transcript_80119/g.225141 Transcript_80119/m.225141 type:complete len:217 (-) Transcript_80119:588-1238(-)
MDATAPSAPAAAGAGVASKPPRPRGLRSSTTTRAADGAAAAAPPPAAGSSSPLEEERLPDVPGLRSRCLRRRSRSRLRLRLRLLRLLGRSCLSCRSAGRSDITLGMRLRRLPDSVEIGGCGPAEPSPAAPPAPDSSPPVLSAPAAAGAGATGKARSCSILSRSAASAGRTISGSADEDPKRPTRRAIRCCALAAARGSSKRMRAQRSSRKLSASFW